MSSEPKPETPANVCAKCGQEQLGKTNRCWKCGAVLIERKRSSPIYYPPGQFPQDFAPGEIQYFDQATDVEEVIIAEIIDEVLLSPSGEQRAADPAGESESKPGAEPTAIAPQAAFTPVTTPPAVASAPPFNYQPPQGIPVPVHQGSPFQRNPFEENAPRKFAVQPESVWMPGMEDYTARGGAVAAFAIGIVTILGGLITGFAFLNGVIGIGLGVWGLSSTKKKMAMIGIGLCILGMFITLAMLIHKATSPTGSGVF